MIPLEERDLEERFQEQYTKYTRLVGRWVWGIRCGCCLTVRWSRSAIKIHWLIFWGFGSSLLKVQKQWLRTVKVEVHDVTPHVSFQITPLSL
jgi:hypothetical protein